MNSRSTNRDRPIMLIFYPLCYAAVLKFLTYYAQEQELCSAHIIIDNYIQVCIKKSLCITEFYKDCYIREYL